MKLICIAHRGEAQTFIKSLKNIEAGLYQGKDYYVLISGEGIFNVLTKLPYIIGKYEVTEIINYGIAGITDSKLAIGEIYPIRTMYAMDTDKPYFHSYTTQNESLVDLITTKDRVLSDDISKKLYEFAPVVDREAWAIGKVATEYKLPMFIYKLISDFAGDTTACFDIKEKTQEFSDKMFEHFITQNFPEKAIERVLELPFHASFTQYKRIDKLLQKINRPADTYIQSFQFKNNKTAANEFITLLEQEINPINRLIEKKLSHVFKAFNHMGAVVLFDKKLDQKKFTLKMEINSQANVKKLEENLKEFKYQDFEDIIDGKIDV